MREADRVATAQFPAEVDEPQRTALFLDLFEKWVTKVVEKDPHHRQGRLLEVSAGLQVEVSTVAIERPDYVEITAKDWADADRVAIGVHPPQDLIPAR